MPRQVLLVDPQAKPDWIRALGEIVGDGAQLTFVNNFPDAHKRVVTAPPDVLVTNLRLEAYNGIHLVLLAAPAGVRCIVYADRHDQVLARQAQEAGAFYTRIEDLRESLRDLLSRHLPDRDRRNPSLDDRRHVRRGGRRSSDLQARQL